MDVETLKKRIATLYDADAIVDLLDISVEQLLDAFEELVLEYKERFIGVEDVKVEGEDED